MVLGGEGGGPQVLFQIRPRHCVVDNVNNALYTAPPQGFGEVQFVRTGQPGTEGSGQLLHYGLMHQGRAGGNGFNLRAGGGGSLVVSVCSGPLYNRANVDFPTPPPTGALILPRLLYCCPNSQFFRPQLFQGEATNGVVALRIVSFSLLGFYSGCDIVSFLSPVPCRPNSTSLHARTVS